MFLEKGGYKETKSRSVSTFEKKNGIKTVRYTHDAMIDEIIANPSVKQNELASIFGYTPSWISLVMSSDAFRARLEARKDEVVDPVLRMQIEEKFKALAHKSLEVLMEKLNTQPSEKLALGAADLAAKALGFGAKERGGIAIQNNVVVVPQKAVDEAQWREMVDRPSDQPATSAGGHSGPRPTVLEAEIMELGTAGAK